MAIFLKIITCVIFDGLFLCICPKFRLYFGKFLSYWENIIFFCKWLYLDQNICQCDQIGLFSKDFGYNFSFKGSLNIS